MEQSRNDKYNVKSLKKSLLILELLVNNERLSIGELSNMTSYGKSTVHRIVGTFMSMQYIDQSLVDGKYFATIKLFELGNVVASRIPIKNIARPYLEELYRECNETVNLGIVDNDEVLYLDKIITKEPLRIDLDIGKRIPAYCSGLGKAIMAFSGKENLGKHNFVNFTGKTIGSNKELQDSLDEIRKDGYAFDDEEYIKGLVCIAVPILGSDGKSIAAISVAVPKTRLTEESKNRNIELLKITAEKIKERSCK